MIGIGIGLLAIGVGDLVAGGIAGVPESKRRVALGTMSTALVAIVAGLAVRMGGRAIELAILVTAVSAAWLWTRAGRDEAAAPPGVAFAVHVVGLGILIGGAQRWDAGGSALLDWVGELPLPGAVDESVLAAGVLVWLAASANALVRTVLAMAGTQVERSQQRLRGGRTIGVIERWLIYGLAIAGQPTAAAVIVSAKSILRFPELSRAARIEVPGADDAPAEVDIITEYFLLGSMVSWLLALAPAVLG